jgi:chromate reductase
MTDVRTREPVHVLVFSASLRADSLNSRLARLAAATVEAYGGDVDLASMAEFNAPSYDGDIQASDGLPAGAEEFRDAWSAFPLKFPPPGVDADCSRNVPAA